MKSALVMSDTVRGALATSALRQAGRIVGVRRGVCTVARLVLAAHHSVGLNSPETMQLRSSVRPCEFIRPL